MLIEFVFPSRLLRRWQCPGTRSWWWQLDEQSLHISSRCLWDPESDTFSPYMFKTTSLFAAANVYLCILNREIVELSSRRKEYSA